MVLKTPYVARPASPTATSRTSMVRLRRFISLLLNLRGYSLRMMLADRSRMVPKPAAEQIHDRSDERMLVVVFHDHRHLVDGLRWRAARNGDGLRGHLGAPRVLQHRGTARADRAVEAAGRQIADRAVLRFRGGVARGRQDAEPGTFSRGVGDALVALKHEPEIDDAEDHDQEQRQRQREFDDGLAALGRSASRD